VESQVPLAYRAYLDFIAQAVGVPVTYLSTGPKREEIIELKAN